MDNDQFGRKDSYLSRRIRRAAKALCRHPGFSYSDIDEYEQHLRHHLWKRRHRFDSSRATFDTFADRIITNETRSMIRDRKRLKRNVDREAYSLNDSVEALDGEETSRHETIESTFCPKPDDGNLLEDYRTFLVQLDPLDRAIHLCRVEGMSKRRIAKLLRILRPRVNEGLKRIREVAIRLGLDGYLGDR